MRGRKLCFSHLAGWQEEECGLRPSLERELLLTLCLMSAEASRNGDGDDGGHEQDLRFLKANGCMSWIE